MRRKKTPIAGEPYRRTRSLRATLHHAQVAAESRVRLKEIIDGSSVATFVIDQHHVVTHWNRACELVTGMPAAMVVGTRQAWRAFYPEERPMMADLILDGALENDVERFYHEKFRKSDLVDGAFDAEDFFPGLGESGRWLFFTAAPLRTPTGQVIGAIETLQDFTERRRAEEAALNLAESVFHNTMDGVLVTDDAGYIQSVNPAFTEITGYTAAEALGQKPSLVRSNHHGNDFFRDLWQSLITHGRWQGEIWNRRKDGEIFLQWLTISRIAGGDGRPVRYVGVFNDITELRRKDEHIRHLAFHDPLTGLPNRALLMDRLEQAIARARRGKDRFGLMFLDLDRFKAINDSLGHDVGDLLLQEVAHRLAQCVRQSDTVARMGGDEFMVLLEHGGNLEAYACLASAIIESISKPMMLRGYSVQVGTSIGIASFPDDGMDAVELMKHADAAMYAAKAAGRGACRLFQPAMTQQARQRLKMEMALRHAVQNGELELYYQPKVSFLDNSLCGVEALVRWRHPVLGLVPPSDFIPLAEETGIINALGDWVLEEACRQGAAWQEQGFGQIRIAVNISAKQLQGNKLVERIAGLARQYRLPPAALEIELTESAIMANPEEVASVLACLREIGVTVAMDDFGTGYSSLAYLRRLPIDVLKIDRSFVMNVDCDDEDAQIVRTILALGHTLKLTVVAEGVETGNQADFLKASGCDAGQGYLYARPASAADFAAWLRHNALAPCDPAREPVAPPVSHWVDESSWSGSDAIPAGRREAIQ